MKKLSEIKVAVVSLSNKELYELLEFVKHELDLSEKAIAEGFEQR